MADVTFEERLDAALPMPDPAEHRFEGIHRTADGRWFGRCSCGHTESPAPDKDTAYEEYVAHLTPTVRRLQLREFVRQTPALLDQLEERQQVIAEFIRRTEMTPR